MRVVKREKLSSIIMNYHVRGQKGKAVINYHDNFKHV